MVLRPPISTRTDTLFPSTSPFRSYSLISDLFPKNMRGTSLAIYSAGLYFGGGISLMIGGFIVEGWNEAWPGGGPFGLVGWQAAFMAVGIPGLLDRKSVV